MQILILHGAARRIAARHFNDYDADIAAMYWVGWHVSAVLKLPSPLIRLAVVLERDPYKIGNSIGAYPALKGLEPATCERAYLEFLGLYDQMTRRPLRTVD